MKRLTVDKSPEIISKILQEINRNETSRYDHRLHGLLLVAYGSTCAEAASMLGRTPKTLENWVHAFNDYGFDGIKENPRQGRPSSLTDDEFLQLDADLQLSPEDFGYPSDSWNGSLLSCHINEKFGKNMSCRQCQRIFHKLGLR